MSKVVEINPLGDKVEETEEVIEWDEDVFDDLYDGGGEN